MYVDIVLIPQMVPYNIANLDENPRQLRAQNKRFNGIVLVNMNKHIDNNIDVNVLQCNAFTGRWMS